MMTYNWCHNSKCHTYKTVGRIRGVKGNKVLRTNKIKVSHGDPCVWDYFCNNQCLFSYISENLTSLVNIAPVHEPRETPIDVQVENRDTFRYKWNSGDYQRVPHIEKVKTIITK